MYGSSGGIDGDVDAMLRQAKTSSETATNLQNSSRHVTSAGADLRSASSGRWADGFADADQSRQTVVDHHLAPKYVAASDAMHRGAGGYQDADEAANQEANRVSYQAGGFGISAQI
ncbi:MULTISPECIES: hypothetical protein [unclassified Amycolatopsis]|uniref:hypothetical protein n=1 Tax=unclassified Amycolatopsis TaxID=2618356 RepID=UPI001FF3FC32|nr:hypothetical protein [Amycolatopsis sp. FBCC-B4732]UOX90925.1 hypothetical protein MUY14_09970 [Amycolatopsis sp. FBCC-B4732]